LQLLTNQRTGNREIDLLILRFLAAISSAELAGNLHWAQLAWPRPLLDDLNEFLALKGFQQVPLPEQRGYTIDTIASLLSDDRRGASRLNLISMHDFMQPPSGN